MMTLIPAYGRDYKSEVEVLEAWNSGKDFTVSDMSSLWDGRLANKEDLEGKKVKIRFNKLRKVLIVG